MTIVKQCPVCESTKLSVFLERSAVPAHQNQLMKTQAAAREMTRGALSLVCCETCGFIFNQHFDPARIAYHIEYEAAQHHSAVFRDHIDSLVDYLLNERRLRASRIVEIGCGDAYFLHRLVDDPALGNTGVGFDPSYRGPECDPAGRLRIERRYFDADAGVAADAVLCRHVIEHIPDPVAALAGVRKALAQSPQARLYYETPCVEWILQGTVIWDFFYEHCAYFTAQSLTTAFARAGFEVERVRHVFGGQYLWLEARLADGAAAVSREAGDIPALAADFGRQESRMLTQLRTQVAELAQNQRLAIWGAGAKGATFANLLDLDRQIFDCVIDINPNKQGCFIGGSGHAIVSLAQAQARGVTAALLMNPNYRHEIERMVQASGAPLALLDADLSYKE